MKSIFIAFTFLCCASTGLFAAEPFKDGFFTGLSELAAQAQARPPQNLSGTAAVTAPGASAAGFISLWSQDCSADSCGLPQPLAPAREVSFDMALPNGPGQAQRKEVLESFILPGAGELKVRLSFYSICPYGAAEGCPSRYFQVQAELSGAAAAFCAASLNAGDFLPFPVFMCAGVPMPGKRLGITLHRI